MAVGHPFDTIKVRLQTQIPGRDGRLPFSGTFNCFSNTIRLEGVQGLFRGLSAPLLGGTLACTVSFGTNGIASHYFTQRNREMNLDHPDRLSYEQLFICGSVSGLVTSTVISPIELVRSLLQIQTTSRSKALYKGSLDCVRQIIQVSGFQGIFRGLCATCARSIPSYGVYFTSYEWMRRMMTPEGKTVHDLSVSMGLIAGGVAGMIGWGCLYPFDVVKSRIQTQPYSKEGVPLRYRGFLDCLWKTGAQEGVGVLYKGLGVTMIRAFPVNAAMWWVYQFTIRLLHKAGY